MCPGCWQKLLKVGVAQNCWVEGRKINFYWRWDQAYSPQSEFIKVRKTPVDYYGDLRVASFLYRLTLEESLSFDVIVYPQKREKDHGERLASLLAAKMQLPFYPVKIEDVLDYKSLGRRQRQMQRRAWIVNKEIKSFRCPLFVDDVVTTGTTMGSLWKALDSPLSLIHI